MIDLVASTVSTIGEKIVLKAAIPFSTIGAKTDWKIDASSATGSSATGSCLLTRLVSRSGVGAGATRTAITAAMATATHTDTGTIMTITASPLTDTATAIKGTATAIKGTATAIKDTATAIVTAEDLRSRSYNAG